MATLSFRARAVLLIVEHLGRDEEYAAALVEKMNDQEVAGIVRQEGNEAAGVSIAAIIFRFRLRVGESRIASAEADVHHAAICKRVKVILPRNCRRAHITKTSGISTFPTPEASID